MNAPAHMAAAAELVRQARAELAAAVVAETNLEDVLDMSRRLEVLELELEAMRALELPSADVRRSGR